MKQQINPAVAAVVIVIIVIVAGVVGFKVLGGSKPAGSTASDSSSQSKMQDYQKQIQSQHGGSSAGHVPGR